MKVSILIPVYNERNTLPTVLQGLAGLKGMDLEVVIADDASRDGTTAWLRQQIPRFPFPVKVVYHEKNLGKGAAVRSAFEASSGEVVLIQDADLEYDPKYIPELVRPIQEGKMDVVYGSRLLAQGSVTYSQLYLWGNKFLTWLINLCCGSRMTDSYTGYKAFRRSVANSLQMQSRGFEIEAEISVKVAMKGWRYHEIPVVYQARSREAGKKINWRDAVKGVRTILCTWWSEKKRLGAEGMNVIANCGLRIADFFRMCFSIRNSKFEIRNNFQSLVSSPASLALVVLVFLGVGLRFWNISYGLPAVFNGDEPHLVNLAVSYGSGDMNPHLFKYPTLWSYLLFGCYGVYYLVWSLFGLNYSLQDFGTLFVRDPTVFYLLGRGLSAFSSSLVLWVLLFWERRLPWSKIFPWSLALLAVSPSVVESAHAAKPESLMLLFSSLSWYFGWRILQHGKEKDYGWCGFFWGLALTTQYTAAPLVSVLWVAHGLRKHSLGSSVFYGDFWKDKNLGWGIAAGISAFVIGTPFSILDPRAFWANVRDLSTQMDLARASHPLGSVVGQVWGNVFTFAGPWSLCGVALLLGAIYLWRQRRNEIIFLGVPTLLAALFLCLQSEGGWARYLFPVFPALAMMASCGAQVMARVLPGRAFQLLLAFSLLFPGAYRSFAFDYNLGLPDTRTLSAAWIRTHIPEGSALLMDQPHASPLLPFSRAQVERLYQKTKAADHSRSRYYALLLNSHPGGGYEVYRLLRGVESLESQPGHVEWSRKGYDLLDARKGLRALRGKVRYVVVTTEGATAQNAPDLKSFFADLETAPLLQEFGPIPHRVRGPIIRIYRIP